MPLPTPSDVHVNRPLTNISVGFLQKATNFVAARAFPIVGVDNQTDVYYSYTQAYWTKDEMQVRGPSSESAGNGFAVDNTPTYRCQVYAFHKDIEDQVRANADSVLSLDRAATLYCSQKALIKREKLWNSAFMQGGVWSYDYDGVSGTPTGTQVLQWNDASSTPIEDVANGKEGVMQATGYEPNKLVLGYPVYKTLINHADIIARLNSGQTPGGPAMANAIRLAEIFEVDEVLVMKGIENTSLENATASHSFIGGKDALLVYAPPSPSLMEPSAGYCFSWTGYVGAGPEGNRISKFRMEHLKSDRVEIEMAFDMKVVSAACGAFWDGVVA